MEGDVNVTIGDAVCKDVTLIATRLTCSLPTEQPQSKTGAEFPEVVVHHGNLNFTIGQLEYVSENYLVYILMGVGIFIVVVIAFIAVLVWLCKVSPSYTTVQEMETHREQLDLQAAQESKDVEATNLRGDSE
ncbi:plexin-B3-like [Acanthaster planci]|uniref:Plexin-B3-like n=1 Tax=Acanthaster planci TaxID=133434 RepID=A0A8B7ZHA5_ACAPL|nr:plexin-B3-like [Acanthaster planci]